MFTIPDEVGELAKKFTNSVYLPVVNTIEFLSLATQDEALELLGVDSHINNENDPNPKPYFLYASEVYAQIALRNSLEPRLLEHFNKPEVSKACEDFLKEHAPNFAKLLFEND